MPWLNVIHAGVSGNASKLCDDSVSHGIINGFTAFIAVFVSTRSEEPKDDYPSV
jgi:hypothetical protein